MIVAELIEKLQELPQYYEVTFEFEAEDKYGHYTDLACVKYVSINEIERVVILRE